MSEVVFLILQKHVWDEIKKIAYCNFLSRFFLPSMQEIVDKAILPNTFLQK